MGRLRVLSGREACRILQQHGFVEVRRRGSHVVMQRRTDAGSVTVPIPDHRELAIGTPVDHQAEWAAASGVRGMI
jgi:predicted RNA binding protein YcfA (HicA-like mRNA interferase family)